MRIHPTMAAAAALVLLAACGQEPPAPDVDPAPAGSEPADVPGAAAPTAGGDYVEQLHSDSLHPGITPADPGTAYIEAAGQRIEFTTVQCSISEDARGENFNATASDDSAGAGHMLYMVRRIGPSVGWAWEDEHVQLALLTTPAGDGSNLARFSNSMAQQNRDQGGEPKWLSGSGQSPLVRLVGNQATGTGTLEGMVLAESPVEGDFVAALTCPD